MANNKRAKGNASATKAKKTTPKKATAKKKAGSKSAAASQVVEEAIEETVASAESSSPAVESSAGAAGALVADDGAYLLEDWTPMGSCLDWRVGLQTWVTRADQLFSRQQVPHLAHDNGALSRRSAELLAQWCEHLGDDLPDRVHVVELGMGTGLHLRYMLDEFIRIAGERDWASRLEVYATDINRGLLDKANDGGLFSGLPMTVNIGGMNALDPGIFVPLGSDERVDLRGQVQVYIANYVLDLMPMDLVRRRKEVNGAQWEAVLARTWLTEPQRLPAYTDLSLEELRVAITEHRYGHVADVFPLLQVELRSYPLDVATHPDAALLERMADLLEARLGADHPLLVNGTVVCHSAGAINVAQRMVESMAEGGFALIRDVALHEVEEAATPRGYQHYGATAAAGLNLIEFDALFGPDAPEPRALLATAPEQDGPRAQGSRMLTKAPIPPVQEAFSRLFDASSFEPVERLVDEARASTDPNEAMDKYREALKLEPNNWVIMLEAAQLALAAGSDPELPTVLLRRGLELNSEYSPDLWNRYGDALWRSEDKEGARRAYTYALDVNPEHAEARYNLAFCEAERGRFDAAMRHIGQALSCDPEGVVRTRSLQLLDVCLRGQQNRYRGEQDQLKLRSRR